MFAGTPEAWQRVHAKHVLEGLRARGASQLEVVMRIDLCDEGSDLRSDAIDALWALRDRGELEHMLAVVFDGGAQGNRRDR